LSSSSFFKLTHYPKLGWRESSDQCRGGEDEADHKSGPRKNHISCLRGAVAEKKGKPGEARANYRLFRQLSGSDPLICGEEQRASRAR